MGVCFEHRSKGINHFTPGDFYSEWSYSGFAEVRKSVASCANFLDRYKIRRFLEVCTKENTYSGRLTSIECFKTAKVLLRVVEKLPKPGDREKILELIEGMVSAYRKNKELAWV